MTQIYALNHAKGKDGETKRRNPIVYVEILSDFWFLISGFCLPKGALAERLRSGLQIRVARFDSGSGLHKEQEFETIAFSAVYRRFIVFVLSARRAIAS